MRSAFLKGFIIIGFLVLAGFMLAPTYKWYYELPDSEKQLASLSRKEVMSLTESIEKNIQTIREAIGNREWFRIGKKEDSRDIILDVRPKAERYILEIEIGKLKTLVAKINPGYDKPEKVESSYNTAKELMATLAKINETKELRQRTIKLGLDLAGGVHFVLGINQEELKKSIEKIYQERMNPEKIRAELKKEHPEYTDTILAQETDKKIAELKEQMQQKIEQEQEEGINRALLKIRSRIDQFGVAEPVIRKGPQSTIVVELPGEKDKESAKEVITKVGRLTLQMVNEEFMKQVPYTVKNEQGYIVDRQYIAQERAKGLPKNTDFFWVQEVDKFGMPQNIGVLPLYEDAEMDGERITDAQVQFDQTGEVYISFSLDGQGAEKFAQITKANIGKRLAIVLDNRIQSAPAIQGEIPTGNAQITGTFSVQEAKTLAAILRSGSLPIPLQIEEERVVGPSLGADQIERGFNSALVALGLIFIFMLIYYRWSGMNVNIAQIFNLFFIFAIMAQLGATLTLPGIAGIVLTIGMSVDANVIINERIKEEMREGRSIESALVHGYHSAFRTILDSNLTTLFAAMVLAVIGTGPIKGFGITLIIGLIANLFTAIFVTHYIYDIFVYKVKVKKISLGGGVK
jgi:preprotein translocase subunit SecD